MNKIHNNKSGFTIIELLIATTVFSVIMLIGTFAIIRISRSYYQGIISNQTEEAARTALATISEAIQFQRGTPFTDRADTIVPIDNDLKAHCVGDKRFTYFVDNVVSNSPEKHALVVDTVAGCNGATQPQDIKSPGIAGTELLGENMRLKSFAVTALDADAGLWKIDITVAYDKIGELRADGTCPPIDFGGQFCAVSTLSATIQKRVQ